MVQQCNLPLLLDFLEVDILRFIRGKSCGLPQVPQKPEVLLRDERYVTTL